MSWPMHPWPLRLNQIWKSISDMLQRCLAALSRLRLLWNCISHSTANSHVEIHCFFAMCVVSSESMLFGTRFNIKFLLDGVHFWHEFEESMRRLDPPSLLCRRLRNGFRSWFNLRWSWSRQPKSRAKVWSFWCCFPWSNMDRYGQWTTIEM